MAPERKKVIVVKLGGSTLGGQTSTGTPDTTLEDILKLAAEDYTVVLVHGGGNAISGLLKQLGQEPRFLNGLRVTDRPALEATLMMLRGRINGELVSIINQAGQSRGILAVGLCGLDGRLLEARRDTAHGDIGLVGEITGVNPAVLDMVLEKGFLPVVSPIGTAVDDPSVGMYNINADNAAAHLAAALQADACVFLTDVPGVLDREKQTIPRLNRAAVGRLVDEGVIYGGMIPKISSALKALEGASRVLIIDGRPANSLYQAVTESELKVGTVFTA
ncbi:MAG: acetylglutamate kinase [Chloroflexi bacterium]|jgi:acetylglutamate kinase|nr:acetylglutamate kinase [Chloroflexota bacterium]